MCVINTHTHTHTYALKWPGLCIVLNPLRSFYTFLRFGRQVQKSTCLVTAQDKLYK